MIAAGMVFHSFSRAALCLFLLSYFLPVVLGHGRLLRPPSRATMWRFGYTSNQPDYNDNQGFCGGAAVLHETFQGKCGVCGDTWLPRPREHERGGIFYTGEVTAHYTAGDVVPAEVEITANHKGFFEFRVCPYDNPETGDLEKWDNDTMVEVSQSCLDKHILHLANGQGTKYHISSSDGVGYFYVNLTIPVDLHCKKCLFQWRYKTGNSWGVDPISGSGCVGCGKQEEFKACADIVIAPSGTSTVETGDASTEETGDTSTVETGDFDTDLEGQWETTDQPVTEQVQWNPIRTTEKTVEVTTETNKGCRPTKIYAQVPGMTEWCKINCNWGYCPASHCQEYLTT